MHIGRETEIIEYRVNSGGIKREDQSGETRKECVLKENKILEKKKKPEAFLNYGKKKRVKNRCIVCEKRKRLKA